VADLIAAYDHWHPQVRAILHAFNETFRWATFERSPMPQCSRGRVTLLGDACHAMLPYLAQGAAQAMEDGVTLAALLSNLDLPAAVPEALRASSYGRRPVSASSIAAAHSSASRNASLMPCAVTGSFVVPGIANQGPAGPVGLVTRTA
jgi:salicylate hydroxylase